MPKAKIRDPWNIVDETITRAVRRAWERRLYKHVECTVQDSEVERIIETISDEVLTQLMETIKFDD
jgi:hypothetical protein